MEARHVSVGGAVDADVRRERVSERDVEGRSAGRGAVDDARPEPFVGYVRDVDGGRRLLGEPGEEGVLGQQVGPCLGPGDDHGGVGEGDRLHVGTVVDQQLVEVGDVLDQALDGILGEARQVEGTNADVEYVDLDRTVLEPGGDRAFRGRSPALEFRSERELPASIVRGGDVEGHVGDRVVRFVLQLIERVRPHLLLGELQTESGAALDGLDLGFGRSERNRIGGGDGSVGVAERAEERHERPSRDGDAPEEGQEHGCEQAFEHAARGEESCDRNEEQRSRNDVARNVAEQQCDRRTGHHCAEHAEDEY